MFLYACRSCGLVVFPERQLCHRCGGAGWEATACDDGVVVALTVVRHGVGTVGENPVCLASVRTELGVTVLARLAGPSEPGATVRLTQTADGAVIGRDGVSCFPVRIKGASDEQA